MGIATVHSMNSIISIASLLYLFSFAEYVNSISVAAGKTEKEHRELCSVTVSNEIQGRNNTPCVFPFIFEGVKYDGVCTNRSDPNGNYWCSTMTDKLGNHISDATNWGYCHKGCEKKPPRTIQEGREKCQLTISDGGPQRNALCVFPFKFNGTFYDGVCTNVGDVDGKYWCSTKTYKKGKRKHHHWVGGENWGYCQDGCDIKPKYTGIHLLHENIRRNTKRPITLPTKRRLKQTKTSCSGIYCDKKFWEHRNIEEIIAIETIKRNWRGFDEEHLRGDYLPNEQDNTCGRSTRNRGRSGRLVGAGRGDAKLGEFPFIASLGYRIQDRMYYNCSGTLINHRYVLTAAHCHNNKYPETRIAEVVLGEHDLSSNPDCTENTVCNNKPVQRFSVTKEDVIVHEKWDISHVKDRANDIALIRLPRFAYTAEEIGSGVHVFPICLPWNGHDASYPSDGREGNQYSIMGWGKTNNNKHDVGDTLVGGAPSNILQKIVLPLIEHKVCRTKYKSRRNITRHKQICAGGENDSCKGDSGGPLIVRKDEKHPMYLRGIISFGRKFCGEGHPGVYTNIEYYIPWIKSHIAP